MLNHVWSNKNQKSESNFWFGERDVSFQMFCIFVLYQDNFIVSRKVPTDIEMACIEIETICSVRNQK